MIVYLLRNNVNDKCYVGQTSTLLRQRLAYHKWAASSDKSTRSAIHNAIAKHGWDNFFVETLEESDCEGDLDMAERFWIRCYGSLRPGGYNVEAGGHALKRLSPETKAKISASKTGVPVHTLEGKAKMSAARRGVTQSKEHSRAISMGLKSSAKLKHRKLSDDDVAEIRKLYSEGVKQVTLRRRYGISPGYIHALVNGTKRTETLPT